MTAPLRSVWPPANPWDLASLGASIVPAVFVIAMFLASPIAPPGADSAHHATFARNILESQYAFVPYSQFPSGGMGFEYPSLFDLSVALLVAGTGADLLGTMEALVVVLTLLSPLVTWRFLRRFFVGGSKDAFVAVALVSLNWFVLAKTVRDGSYGELLAAGVILPLWLSFMWDRRDLLAAGSLFAIVIAHNLTALLAFGTFLGFLVYFGLERKWGRIRRILAAHAAVVGLTALLVWPVYASYLLPVAGGTAGGFPVIDPFTYAVIVTPILFVFGIGGISVMIRDPRWRFMGLWLAAYAILSRTSFASERIAREMSIPLAVGTAGLVLRLVKDYDKRRSAGRPSWRVVPLVAVVLLATTNGLLLLGLNTDPNTLRYLEPYQVEAYRWLADHSNSSKGALALASLDPFLSVFISNDVFPIVNPRQAETLSRPDRDLNAALVRALLNYSDPAYREVFASNGIEWIVLSSPFSSPVWLAPEDIPFIEQAWNLTLDSDPGYVLRHSVFYPTGSTRVFQIMPVGGRVL
jgi:uncharacterized membrane protein YhdT